MVSSLASLRIWLALAVGFVVTAAIFLAMNAILLHLDAIGDIEPEETVLYRLPIIRIEDEPHPRPLPDRPAVAPPPPLVTYDARSDARGRRAAVTANVHPTVDDPVGEALGGEGEFDGIGERIVEIEPVYPMQARLEQTEGFVVVGFDVTAMGAPEKIEVLKADPEGVFEAAAVEAVQQWRYQPWLVQGRPRPRRGQRIRITFELDARRQRVDALEPRGQTD